MNVVRCLLAALSFRLRRGTVAKKKKKSLENVCADPFWSPDVQTIFVGGENHFDGLLLSKH